ncbi:MAG: hypothetical protein IPL14_08420 [Nitrospira sp.]|nr:hypothetical protein [Nitrospira sp.]
MKFLFVQVAVALRIKLRIFHLRLIASHLSLGLNQLHRLKGAGRSAPVIRRSARLPFSRSTRINWPSTRLFTVTVFIGIRNPGRSDRY